MPPHRFVSAAVDPVRFVCKLRRVRPGEADLFRLLIPRPVPLVPRSYRSCDSST